jgi:hypothetical protein
LLEDVRKYTKLSFSLETQNFRQYHPKTFEVILLSSIKGEEKKHEGKKRQSEWKKQ